MSTAGEDTAVAASSPKKLKKKKHKHKRDKHKKKRKKHEAKKHSSKESNKRSGRKSRKSATHEHARAPKASTEFSEKAQHRFLEASAFAIAHAINATYRQIEHKFILCNKY